MDAKQKIEAALAAGPTEGPWKTDAYGTVKVGRYSLCTPGAGESLSLMAASNKAKTNAAFIAACNPANTRELLQTLASKEAEVARLREALQDIADDTSPDNEDNYRADDREGCLDATHANAVRALTQPTE